MLVKIFLIFLTFVFSLTSLSIPPLQASQILPDRQVLVGQGQLSTPPLLTGLKVNPQNPFKLQFILDNADQLSSQQLNASINQNLKYFLAGLTVSQQDWWVNLSPYENDRIVPPVFGQTLTGRDLLAQDLWLKQITASYMNPEHALGKKFWQKIYAQASKTIGNTEVNINAFNKVWIVPQNAEVYEGKGVVYVKKAYLKVMLEEDYLAKQANAIKSSSKSSVSNQNVTQATKEIIRSIILPELEREVNEGEHFAPLRQIYNTLILATWYKNKLKESILNQVYADQQKTVGLSDEERASKSINVEKIYERYIQAFKQGAYNLIRDEVDPVTKETVSRHYFAGGTSFVGLQLASQPIPRDPSMLSAMARKVKEVTVSLLIAGATYLSSVSLKGQVFENYAYVRTDYDEENQRNVLPEYVAPVIDGLEAFNFSTPLTLEPLTGNGFDGNMRNANGVIGGYNLYQAQGNAKGYYVMKFRPNTSSVVSDFYFGINFPNKYINFMGENKPTLLNVDTERPGWQKALSLVGNQGQIRLQSSVGILQDVARQLPVEQLFMVIDTNSFRQLRLTLAPPENESGYRVVFKTYPSSFPNLKQDLDELMSVGGRINAVYQDQLATNLVQKPFTNNPGSRIWGYFTVDSVKNSSGKYWGLLDKEGEVVFIAYDLRTTNIESLANLMNRVLSSSSIIDDGLYQELLTFVVPTTTSGSTRSQYAVWSILDYLEANSPGRFFTPEQFYHLVIRANYFKQLNQNNKERLARYIDIYANGLSANFPTTVEEYYRMVVPSVAIFTSMFGVNNGSNPQSFFTIAQAHTRFTDAQLKPFLTNSRNLGIDPSIKYLFPNSQAAVIAQMEDRFYRLHLESSSNALVKKFTLGIEQEIDVELINRQSVELKQKVINSLLNSGSFVMSTNYNNIYDITLAENALRINAITEAQRNTLNAYLTYAFERSQAFLQNVSFTNGAPTVASHRSYINALLKTAKMLNRMSEANWLIPKLNPQFNGRTNIPNKESDQAYQQRLAKLTDVWVRTGIMYNDQVGYTSFFPVEDGVAIAQLWGPRLPQAIHVLQISPDTFGGTVGVYNAGGTVISMSGQWMPTLSTNNLRFGDMMGLNFHEGMHGVHLQNLSGSYLPWKAVYKLRGNVGVPSLGGVSEIENPPEVSRRILADGFGYYTNTFKLSKIYDGAAMRFAMGLREHARIGSNGKLEVPLTGGTTLTTITNSLGLKATYDKRRILGRMEINSTTNVLFLDGIPTQVTLIDTNERVMEVINFTYGDNNFPTHIKITDGTGKVIVDRDTVNEQGTVPEVFALANPMPNRLDDSMELLAGYVEEILDTVTVAQSKGEAFSTDQAINDLEEKHGVIFYQDERTALWKIITKLRASPNPETAFDLIVANSKSFEHKGAQADAAMHVPALTPTGGIDLSTLNEKLKTSKNSSLFNLAFDPATVERLGQSPGFVPRIDRITNINLATFLQN